MRYQAVIALIIFFVIVAFAVLEFSAGEISISTGGDISVEENGTEVVASAQTLDFLDPFEVTAGVTANVAQIDFDPLEVPLSDDNIWVGSSSGLASETALPGCDGGFEALTYEITGNTVDCHQIPGIRQAADPTGIFTWSIPGYTCDVGSQGFISGNQNDIFYLPIVPAETATYNAIGLNVTSSGGGGTVVRLGIYEANETATGFAPGALIVDAGTVAISSTGSKTIAISETLNQGQVYFLAFVHSASSVSYTGCSASSWQVTPFMGRAGSTAGSLRSNIPRADGIGTGAFSDPAAAPDGYEPIELGTVVRLQE